MTKDPGPAGIFELHDAAPGRSGQDLLGLWQTVPLEPARAVPGSAAEGRAGAEAFGVPGETPAEAADGQARGLPLPVEAPVWRASFPADSRAIATYLGQAQRQLQTAEAALAATPARLDAFVARGLGGLAYTLPAPGTERVRPEDDLSLLLAEFQGVEPMVNYGLAEQVGGRWKQAVGAFQAFAARLQQMAVGLAWVETTVGGQLVGQTVVTWTGDVRTVVPTRIKPAQAKLHQRTLHLALVSRWMVLRISALTIASAVKLSALAATPGGVVLVIPAVLRFINQVRIEFESYQK